MMCEHISVMAAGSLLAVHLIMVEEITAELREAVLEDGLAHAAHEFLQEVEIVQRQEAQA